MSRVSNESSLSCRWWPISVRRPTRRSYVVGGRTSASALRNRSASDAALTSCALNTSRNNCVRLGGSERDVTAMQEGQALGEHHPPLQDVEQLLRGGQRCPGQRRRLGQNDVVAPSAGDRFGESVDGQERAAVIQAHVGQPSLDGDRVGGDALFDDELRMVRLDADEERAALLAIFIAERIAAVRARGASDALVPVLCGVRAHRPIFADQAQYFVGKHADQGADGQRFEEIAGARQGLRVVDAGRRYGRGRPPLARRRAGGSARGKQGGG